MAEKPLDESWKSWLRENLERKCDVNTLLGILVKNHFSIASIEEHMGDRFPVHSPLLQQLGLAKGIDYKALTEVSITRGPVKFPSEKVQLYLYENFMSGEECDAIIALIEQRLRASTVTIRSTPKDYRTSSTSDLGTLQHRLVDELDDKIAHALGIRLPYSESIQGQKYLVGQQFKKHTDFFAPGTDEYGEFAGPRGNRTWTFMVYLNDVKKGGGTEFLNLGHVFMPRRGRALIWNNLRADGKPNPDTLHAGLPVEDGEKFIITKWFREHGGGPMLY